VAVAPLHSVAGAPRWTAPHRWHLTLLFLGVVPEPCLAPLLAAAGPTLADTPAMHLRLAGGGRFGSARRPQVVWAGLEGDVEALAALAARLAQEARALRLPVEDRPFRPHLTLGRWRPRQPADGTLGDRLARYRGPAWPVTEVRLWESRLGPDPTYDGVAEWSLTTRTPSARPGIPGRSRPGAPALRRPG
jgi:2'-5' RNA ligase